MIVARSTAVQVGTESLLVGVSSAAGRIVLPATRALSIGGHDWWYSRSTSWNYPRPAFVRSPAIWESDGYTVAVFPFAYGPISSPR